MAGVLFGWSAPGLESNAVMARVGASAPKPRNVGARLDASDAQQNQAGHNQGGTDSDSLFNIAFSDITKCGWSESIDLWARCEFSFPAA